MAVAVERSDDELRGLVRRTSKEAFMTLELDIPRAPKSGVTITFASLIIH